MGLTSPWLVALLAGVAGVLLACALWFWRTLGRPGIGRVLGRVAVIGLLDVAVVGLIFTVVNRSAGFYASWGELFGTEHLTGHVVALRHAGSGPAGSTHPGGDQVGLQGHSAGLTVLSRSAVAVPGDPHAAAGRLSAVRMTGPVSGVSALGYVYAPALALPPGGAHLKLPVIVVVSDRIGAAGTAFSASRIAQAAAMQMAAGRLRPALIVMLPASVVPGTGSGCLNVPGGPQVAAFFTQDLPQLMRSHYPASSNPSQWALAGDSSGAYCALQLVLTNSATYSVAAAPPGYYQPALGPAGSGLSQPLRDQFNLLYLLRHQPMQPVSILLTGTPALSRPFLALVRPPMSAASAELSGERTSIAPVLDWIGRELGRVPGRQAPGGKAGDGKAHSEKTHSEKAHIGKAHGGKGHRGRAPGGGT